MPVPVKDESQGGLTLQTLFGDLDNSQHLLYGVLAIGAIATLYTAWGG